MYQSELFWGSVFHISKWAQSHNEWTFKMDLINIFKIDTYVLIYMPCINKEKKQKNKSIYPSFGFSSIKIRSTIVNKLSTIVSAKVFRTRLVYTTRRMDIPWVYKTSHAIMCVLCVIGRKTFTATIVIIVRDITKADESV